MVDFHLFLYEGDVNPIYLFQLSSPVVNAWRIKGSDIQQIDLFSTNSVPALCPETGQPYEENTEVSNEYCSSS